jgi:predicted DsbA family dithiol-disulfide isomerase
MSTSTSSEPSTPDTDHPLIIELWTDLGCPWCYIGKHRLEQAIAAAVPVGQVQLTLRSFELDPDMSATAVSIPEVFDEMDRVGGLPCFVQDAVAPHGPSQ